MHQINIMQKNKSRKSPSPCSFYHEIGGVEVQPSLLLLVLGGLGGCSERDGGHGASIQVFEPCFEPELGTAEVAVKDE